MEAAPFCHMLSLSLCLVSSHYASDFKEIYNFLSTASCNGSASADRTVSPFTVNSINHSLGTDTLNACCIHMD